METPENVQFVKLCLIPVSILGYSLQIQCVHFLGYSLVRKWVKNGSGKMKSSKKYKKSADFTRNQRIFGPSGGI